MPLNAAKVLVGSPDQQSTTGAIRTGDIITPENLPSTFAEAEEIIAAMSDSGYVSEDGLELSTDMSTSDIREWGRAIVRKLLDSYDGTIGFTLIQSDEASWKQAIGDAYVEATAATASAGEQLVIKMGAHMAPPKSWGFAMKDGDARVIIIVPNGQVTTLDTITFNSTEAIALPVTVSCYDDGTSNSIYVFLDDGQKAASA